MVRSRADVLELAILGLLHDAPMHGYELRKRLNLLFGPFRALSYGSLYPALRVLAEGGLISAEGSLQPPPHALAGKRARHVYALTADGKERLADALTLAGPTTWDDEHFDVRFALFAQTDAMTRLRILEGRRARLAERLELLRTSAARTRERVDEYTQELHRHGLEQVEHEVAWLDGLIDRERDLGRTPRRRRTASHRTDGPRPGGGSEEP